ncbi:hypothetical protein AW736_05110 [Termitidicoccus mucosus]|uniref:TonB-dependent receptor plug domain-containing protein n=1 Tax=Termitidicoccus mucosus TaxID=1184151 RepID=A0A178IPJ4_9BACT|nr:hypothetical protein AW736_05110 [Opitutaceae bacterium TSB47]
MNTLIQNSVSRRMAVACMCFCLTHLGVNGQAQGAPSPGGGTGEDSEIVTLEEFTVTTSAMSEYVAAETISGTRVAIKLRDLPFSVNVVTSEFLDDFTAFEFIEQTSYTSGVVGYESLHSGYSVRGIDANVQLRNGFRRIGLIDKVNVDRMEVIKGAAASIYGTVMPGGTVNIITKKPKAKPEQSLSFATGSDNLFRAQASSTGPLDKAKRFLYRVDMAVHKTDYDIPYKRMEQWTVAPQFLWKLGRHTSLSLEYEYLKRYDDATAYIPYAISLQPDLWRRQPGDGLFPDQDTPNTALIYGDTNAIHNPALFNFNAAGPNSKQSRYTHTVSATFEHRFTRNISLRSSFNWYERGRTRSEFSGRNVYDPTSDSIAAGTAVYWPNGQGSAAWQTDLLANWKTGALNHVTLFTLDFQRLTEWQKRYDGNTQNVRIVNTVTGAAATRAIPLIYPGAREAIAALPTAVVGNATLPYLELNGVGSHWMLGEADTVLNYNTTLGIPRSNAYNKFYRYEDYPELYHAQSYDEDNSLDIYGAFLSHRITLWENRATLFGGVRYDYLDNHARDFLGGTDRARANDAVSYQFGANFRIVNSLTAYVNMASSFTPDFTAGSRPKYDEDTGTMRLETFDIPNEHGVSKEIGFKAGLFGEKLVFTLAYFDIKRENIKREARYFDEASNAEVLYDVINGSETSKGVEFDYNWAIIPNQLQIFGQYGYIKSEIHNAGSTPGFNGGPTLRTPEHRAATGVKYNFRSGPLKGLYITAGFRYEGRSRGVSGSARRIRGTQVTDTLPFVNNPYPNGDLPFPNEPAGKVLYAADAANDLVIYLPDGRETIYNPTYRLFEAGVGYSWKTGRTRHKIQLNVRNLFDEIYTYGANAPGAERNFVFTYEIKY